MLLKRRQYLEYRRKKWAAGVVSLSWLLFVKAYKIRDQLKALRAQQLIRHHQRATGLRRRWEELRELRRTVLHLPSLGEINHTNTQDYESTGIFQLYHYVKQCTFNPATPHHTHTGYSQPVRAGLPNFIASQALQMARLCDLRNPLVEVIYISPIPVDQAVLDFYVQLLSIEGQNVKDRVHVITPENTDKFGHHNLSLAAYLLYSPKALTRVRNLLKGKEAYIVPGVVSRDDISLADKLSELNYCQYCMYTYSN